MREIKGTHPRAFASVRARTHRTRVNGGTPYTVREIDGDVHVRDDEGTSVWRERVFRLVVGRDPQTGHGNCVLAERGDGEYVFVGERVYAFRSRSVIAHLVSPMGPNEVPYPYAIDAEDNVYLLLEDVRCRDVPASRQRDPYEWFYEQSLITADRAFQPPRRPAVRSTVQKLHVNHRTVTMVFRPRSEWFWRATWWHVRLRIHGEWITCTVDDAIALTHRFADGAGFDALSVRGIHDS